MKGDEDVKPIRIPYVLGGTSRGGIETRLLRVLRRIDRTAFANDVLVHADKEGVCDAGARQLRSRPFHCPHVPTSWRSAADFGRTIRDHGPCEVV
jgi:hypothetical protein